MRITRRVFWHYSMVVMGLSTTVACAQTTAPGSAQPYPHKPIRIVVAEAGGTSDFAGRLIGQTISGSLGQPLIVDNRGIAFSGEIVSKAPPDGYTVLLNGSGFCLAPLLQAKPSYDATRDFAAVSMATTSPNILIVHPSL